MSNGGAPQLSVRTKATFAMLAALLLLAFSATAVSAKSASVKANAKAGATVDASVDADASTAGLVDTVTGVKTVLHISLATFQALARDHIYSYFDLPARITGFEFTSTPGQINILATFPISGGTLVANSNLGTISHSGGLRIVKTDDHYQTIKTLASTDFQILNGMTFLAFAHALDGTPIIGNLGAPSAVADITNVKRTVNADGSITLEGDYLLNAVTAQVLNVYFGTDVFVAGLNLGHGVSTITTTGAL